MKASRPCLKLNPNYGGHRPHHLKTIVYTGVFGLRRAIARVAASRSDFTPVAGSYKAPVRVDQLNARYGSHSPAAQRGHQQLFINPAFESDAIVLNTSRPLFASAKLRRAANYAISRSALARLGGIAYGTGPLTATVTDQYLTPGPPGFRDRSFYPLQGDLKKARQLAGQTARKAVLYTCDYPLPCPQEAQIVKESLAKIGIDVEVRKFPIREMFKRESHARRAVGYRTDDMAVRFPRSVRRAEPAVRRGPRRSTGEWECGALRRSDVRPPPAGRCSPLWGPAVPGV